MEKKSLSAAFLLCALMILVPAQAQNPPLKEAAPLPVPLGSWHYGIYLGGQRIGTADISVSFENGIYQSVNNMAIEKNNKEQVYVMTETVRETASCVPV
ncbi:MAG: hypothetical protein ACRCUT_08375, partial [Spirochaetota bacterium]